MKNKFFNFKSIVIFLFVGFYSVVSYGYQCTIQSGETGCCTSADCGSGGDECLTSPNDCPAPEGNCQCGDANYCNTSAHKDCCVIRNPLNPTKCALPGAYYWCDTCCCTLEGGSGGGTWRGIRGYVWSDFNNDGVLNSISDPSGIQFYHEEYRGDPFDIGDCSTEAVYPTNDFSVIISGSGIDTPENIARNWHCFGTPRIGTQKYEYYSHLNDYNEDNNAGMVRNGQYVATLGNIPADSSCGEWEVFDPAEGETWTLQRRGSGCDANFTMTATNDYMKINWKLGPPLCTPQNGNLSDWSHCSNGSQTSTCEDATSCPVGCTPGEPGCVSGSCSVECVDVGGNYNSSTNICTRNCLYVEGNIWSDDNGNTVKDNFEKWRDSTYLSGCSTPKVHPSFTLNYTGEAGNQIKGWWCHVTAGAYYRGSTGVAANIEPGQSHTFTLSNWPDGYKPKSWVYNHPGYSISGNWSGFGSFSTSSIIMPTSGWTNVHWELQQQTYNLTIKVKDIPPETLVEYSGDSCTLDLSVLDNLSDATVIISSATGAELCNKTTDSNGEVTCDIWVNQGDLNITVRKRVNDEEVIRTYSMVCPSKGSYPYNPGVVADGDSKTELVGLKESYKESWVSAVDSDIFAKEVNVVVPLGTGSNPAGFVKALLNSYDNITGGFVFSKDQITNPHEDTLDEGTTYNLLFEDDLGGRAENLDSGGSNHNSKWLESFTFEAPNGATEISDLNTSLNSGVIYKSSGITTLPNTYTLSGTGVAVLYIDNDLTINNNFTTSSSGRLLLVVNGSVTISKDVGTDVGSFNLSQDPNIEAGIIASGKIEFESIGGSITENSHDDPIMVSAPLITRDLTDGIIFSRDLYHDNNATMPAESAKAFNKYLYLLTSLEREKSQDNLYFTGLTTYDLDWEYIY